MDRKCLQVLVLINTCMMLCVALPLSYRQPGESAHLFKKLFPGSQSSIPDDWSKSERSMFAPSEDRSKFQSIHDEELKEDLLRDILDWQNKRRPEQFKQGQAINEKREPQRCYPWNTRCQNGRDESTEEDESRRVLALGNREPGGVMNEMDAMKMKEYDMELEKTLRNLENDRPDILSSYM